MKTVLAALISALLFLLALGCGAAQVTPAGPEATQKSTSVAEKPAAVTAAWQKRWEDALQAARKEEKVVLYSSLGGETNPAMARAFRDKFGIDLEFVTGSGADISAKVLNERRAGLYLADAFIVGAGELIPSIKTAGVLDPMEPALILPEVIDPAAWNIGRVPFLDKDRSVIAFIAGYRDYVFFNSNMVKETEIRSYQDLLNPKWKGKMVLFDPSRSGSGSTWFSMMLMEVYDRQKGADYMRQFVKQEPVITADGRLHVEWVARGKYPVGVAGRRESTSEFVALGAPIGWASNMVEGGEISPGTGCMGLANRPAHPNGASVFVNWLLSKEGQDVFVKAFGSPSARKDASTAGLDPAMIAKPGQKVYIANEDFYMAKPEMVTLAKQIFGDLLK